MVFLENPLTDAGEDYVVCEIVSSLLGRRQDCTVAKEWLSYYDLRERVKEQLLEACLVGL